MHVVTPRCAAAAAAAVVSAVVLRRPTNEYTHRYSMMHRRLTNAGTEVAPHYHQLLVVYFPLVFTFLLCSFQHYENRHKVFNFFFFDFFYLLLYHMNLTTKVRMPLLCKPLAQRGEIGFLCLAFSMGS